MKRILMMLTMSGALASTAADLSRTADPMISITPVARSFLKEGGSAGINTGGSGTWYASSSDSWISVKTPSGTPPGAVAYTVEANDDVETRVGTVWVSGHKHTVTQSGTGAALESYSAEFEKAGGQGKISVIAAEGNAWTVRANVDWLVPSAKTGSGSGSISYTVKSYDEVATRSGTITIAENTFTVTQTGARMKLRSYSATSDYFADTIKVRINALASTEWSVSVNPEATSWVTVTDAGSGRGSDTVTLALTENLHYSERTATVTIGTETFSIRQLKRTDLVFKIGSTELVVGAEGVTGERIAVTATPDLKWAAEASADWIKLYDDYKGGSGNGSIAFKVEANPTLYARSGTIMVTANGEGVAAKKFEIAQAAAVSALSISSYVFESTGEVATVSVTVPDIVGWSVRNAPAWLKIAGIKPTGPATLTLTAEKNPSVKPRTATLSIADHDFTVTQKGRGVMVDYTAKVFDTDGKTTGLESENVVNVTADADVHWTAEASDATWIVIYEGLSGQGAGKVKYVVAPYVGAGEMRTGTITIGDQVVTITQRAYEVMIDPAGTNVVGNAGAGEIQVALDVGGALRAFCNDEWIKLTIEYDEKKGYGRVIYTYLDNNTGKTRVGKINISGLEYTLEQAARQNVALTAEVEGHGGKVSGGGTYNVGTTATLFAEPEPGYVFDHWVLPGGGRSSESVLSVVVNGAQAYKAVFKPVKPTLAVAMASFAGVRLVWTNVPWAVTYKIYRNSQFSPSQATLLATLENDATCVYLDKSGTERQLYYYWVEAVGAVDDVWSDAVSATRVRKTFAITYANLRGTTHANPATYTEGASVSLSAPSGRLGYTFVGWTPSGIAADATGPITVRARWIQNTYSVHFDANGGKSAMDDQPFTYGFWQDLSKTNVTRTGSTFNGWSTMKGGQVEYADQASLKNLTEKLDDVVTLYAIWTVLIGIEGDPNATVTGNDEEGYVIKPSDGKTEIVVIIPQGLDPKKITLEVSPDVQTIRANGAILKVVRGGHDITGYLKGLDPDPQGRINLAEAKVKDEIVKETLDPSKGAVIVLDPAAPKLTTTDTKPGLTYTLHEGVTVEEMPGGDRKLGDGNPWTPTITIKGGASGFYSIEVDKK